ncbi:putative thaumatin family protein [Phaeomoniella chlamydospora]|uniref:Putative thaumatin family protein n=1 Tax=Phaeomoniella chlamydospora TaxID=158046 RepID=A0A0G2GB86_PHACM|nr:putative thaumatin family protein [Phaeomoniella chlamydospora]
MRNIHLVWLTAIWLPSTFGIHHMKKAPLHWVNKRASDVSLVVTNYCAEDIYPGIQTQAGTAPDSQGFLLEAGGSTRKQTVSADWQGRIWGRTNCSFNDDGTTPANGIAGKACTTGDCGGTVVCQGTGEVPATLAEFTLESGSGQTYYDISLVDGYNIPLGIISLLGTSGNSTLTDIPPNLTNPMCVGTASQLSAQGNDSATEFGTNSTYPIPLAQGITFDEVQEWCPWPLQQDPPSKPGDGVYPYPDDNIKRPFFDPCLSACAKWGKAEYCCTGSHDSPSKCQPSEYSTQAKKVCPDAYSYAYDDQTSTFIIPSGGGFEVVFCPSGSSSTILTTFSSQLSELASTGEVTTQMLADTQNLTLIRSDANTQTGEPNKSLLAAVVILAFAIGMSNW